YDPRVEGNNIIVRLGGSAGHAAAAAPSGAAPAAPVAGGPRELRSIDFRRGADGAGRVVVRLSDPHIRINLHQVGNQVVVDFSDAAAPANLLRRYDATDYGTPISGFDVTRVGNGSRIAITATGDYEQLAYQSDDQYVVEVAPRRKLANAPEERPVYTGERLTLNFQDIETRAVLQLLADASGQDTGVPGSVRGSVAVDERTNTLLLQDTAERLADVRRLVATLDIPVRQVLIEARIVIVSNDFQRQLGARFGVTNWQRNGQNGLVSTTGTAAGVDTMNTTYITGQNAINNAINAGTVPVPLPTYGIP